MPVGASEDGRMVIRVPEEAWVGANTRCSIRCCYILGTLLLPPFGLPQLLDGELLEPE